MENKYDLICMDLDGTLLDSQKFVSERAKKALREARERGIQIALLSGRMPQAVWMVERQLGFSNIIGSIAGTYITMDGRCIGSHTMDREKILLIYDKIARKYNIPLWVYQGTKWYVTKVDSYVKRESEIIELEPKVIGPNELVLLMEQENIAPNKLLFGADPDTIDAIKEDLQNGDYADLDFARSDAKYLEIMPKGANKGEALHIICEALKIDSKKTIAFGDQELDIAMLTEAGFGVAMGNAPEHIKEVADAVTAGNDEDGVAIALEKYVLKIGGLQ